MMKKLFFKFWESHFRWHLFIILEQKWHQHLAIRLSYEINILVEILIAAIFSCWTGRTFHSITNWWLNLWWWTTATLGNITRITSSHNRYNKNENSRENLEKLHLYLSFYLQLNWIQDIELLVLVLYSRLMKFTLKFWHLITYCIQSFVYFFCNHTNLWNSKGVEYSYRITNIRIQFDLQSF